MKKIYFGILVAFAAALCSCSTNKTSLTYFEDLKATQDGTVDASRYAIRIVPDDELVITVNSVNPDVTTAYNLPLINPSTARQAEISTIPVQQTYIVNSNGDISMPMLGTIHVAGMTTTELTDYLKKRISADVEDPIVRVELIGYAINVLGEVNHPGRQYLRTERYSLLDALAAAGDLSIYGERSNVLLIREENGKLTYHHFNLNDSKTLESPYFYLKQNDVIVVEPNSIRKDNSKYNQFNSYKISVISTVVSACSVIASLVIALAVK